MQTFKDSKKLGLYSCLGDRERDNWGLDNQGYTVHQNRIIERMQPISTCSCVSKPFVMYVCILLFYKFVYNDNKNIKHTRITTTE